MSAIETRTAIVDRADRLFYEKGYEATSLADIAVDVGLSRGNFYYHFRTKDEILAAVVTHRIVKTRALLKSWEAAHADPSQRILSFIRILIANRKDIISHGCPVGTLCNELSKLRHTARKDAAQLFVIFREWLAHQFSALGRADDADELALHALMRSQGIATLATAFRDKDFIRREVAQFEKWLAAEIRSRPESK